jgi:hypothetical protein
MAISKIDTDAVGAITNINTGGATALTLQTNSVTALNIDASQKVTFANSLTSPTLVTPVINGMGSSVLTSGTVQASTSGTSIDFTGIPSWAKRITVMFNNVSTNGTSIPMIQVGSGSVIATGYATNAGYAGNAASSSVTSATTGFIISGSSTAIGIFGSATIYLLGSNTWIFSVAGTQGGGTFLGGGGVSPCPFRRTRPRPHHHSKRHRRF